MPGISAQPAEDAPWTKKRLGQVGPGMEENQWSQMANSVANCVDHGQLRPCVETYHDVAVLGRSGQVGVVRRDLGPGGGVIGDKAGVRERLRVGLPRGMGGTRTAELLDYVQKFVPGIGRHAGWRR